MFLEAEYGRQGPTGKYRQPQSVIGDVLFRCTNRSVREQTSLPRIGQGRYRVVMWKDRYMYIHLEFDDVKIE